MPNIDIHAIRITPGEDLKKSLQSFVNENKLTAAWICTCAGSLEAYNIRFANQPEPDNGKGYFEITSLSGTLSPDGCHVHICISDSSGKTIGGHLMEGCKIYTTAEIVIQSTEKLIFKRVHDVATGWNELKIESNNN